jgi:hypothetical protein
MKRRPQTMLQDYLHRESADYPSGRCRIARIARVADPVAVQARRAMCALTGLLVEQRLLARLVVLHCQARERHWDTTRNLKLRNPGGRDQALAGATPPRMAMAIHRASPISP